jgi:hypothetical protein
MRVVSGMAFVFNIKVVTSVPDTTFLYNTYLPYIEKYTILKTSCE